jgi:hypothetical protein
MAAGQDVSSVVVPQSSAKRGHSGQPGGDERTVAKRQCPTAGGHAGGAAAAEAAAADRAPAREPRACAAPAHDSRHLNMHAKPPLIPGYERRSVKRGGGGEGGEDTGPKRVRALPEGTRWAAMAQAPAPATWAMLAARNFATRPPHAAPVWPVTSVSTPLPCAQGRHDEDASPAAAAALAGPGAGSPNGSPFATCEGLERPWTGGSGGSGSEAVWGIAAGGPAGAAAALWQQRTPLSERRDGGGNRLVALALTVSQPSEDDEAAQEVGLGSRRLQRLCRLGA